MNRHTMIIIAVAAAAALGGYAISAKDGATSSMAELMRKAGQGAECESIEHSGREWLSCRRSDAVAALWLRADDDSGTTWIAADSAARESLASIRALSSSEKAGLPKTRPQMPGEDLPPAP